MYLYTRLIKKATQNPTSHMAFLYFFIFIYLNSSFYLFLIPNSIFNFYSFLYFQYIYFLYIFVQYSQSSNLSYINACKYRKNVCVVIKKNVCINQNTLKSSIKKKKKKKRKKKENYFTSSMLFLLICFYCITYITRFSLYSIVCMMNIFIYIDRLYMHPSKFTMWIFYIYFLISNLVFYKISPNNIKLYLCFLNQKFIFKCGNGWVHIILTNTVNLIWSNKKFISFNFYVIL